MGKKKTWIRAGVQLTAIACSGRIGRIVDRSDGAPAGAARIDAVAAKPATAATDAVEVAAANTCGAMYAKPSAVLGLAGAHRLQ